MSYSSHCRNFQLDKAETKKFHAKRSTAASRCKKIPGHLHASYTSCKLEHFNVQLNSSGCSSEFWAVSNVRLFGCILLLPYFTCGYWCRWPRRAAVRHCHRALSLSLSLPAHGRHCLNKRGSGCVFISRRLMLWNALQASLGAATDAGLRLFFCSTGLT